MFALCKFQMLPASFSCKLALRLSMSKLCSLFAQVLYTHIEKKIRMKCPSKSQYFPCVTPGEILPEDAERADGDQKQGRSILSCLVVSPQLLTFHPVHSEWNFLCHLYLISSPLSHVNILFYFLFAATDKRVESWRPFQKEHPVCAQRRNQI